MAGIPDVPRWAGPDATAVGESRSASERRPNSEVSMSDRPRASILVVEDDADLQALIAECLESEGFAVARTSDAASAIERLQGFAYDGLVIDLRLPDASGMNVLDEALTRFPGIRAVVMTGCGGVADAVTAIRRGALDFLVKPFELARLAVLLREHITPQPAAEA